MILIQKGVAQDTQTLAFDNMLARLTRKDQGLFKPGAGRVNIAQTGERLPNCQVCGGIQPVSG